MSSDDKTPAETVATSTTTAPASAVPTNEQLKRDEIESSESLLDIIGELTAEQNEAVIALRAKIDAKKDSLSPSALRDFKGFPRVFLVRHLISRKWVVSDAEEMIFFASRWRIQDKIDEMPLFPPIMNVRGFDVERLAELRNCGRRPQDDHLAEAFRCMRGVVSNGYHKHDRMGRVIYWDRLGHLDAVGLVAKLKQLTKVGENPHDLAIQMRVYSNEMGAALVRLRNEENKKVGLPPSTSVTVITDCSGLGFDFLHGPALDVLKAQGEFDRLRMSEGIHKVLMINAGAATRFLWGAVKMFVDERTRNKFVFLAEGEETSNALNKFVAPENLPVEFGGACACPGGCMPDFTPSSAKNRSESEKKKKSEEEHQNDYEPKVKTLEIHVSAGNTEKMHITVSPGKEKKVRWALMLAERDVNFSIHFDSTSAGADKEEKSRVIRIVEKVGASASHRPDAVYDGEFTVSAEEDGVVCFSFDNQYSWMRGKTVQFRAEVHETSSAMAENAHGAAAAAAAAADDGKRE